MRVCMPQALAGAAAASLECCAVLPAALRLAVAVELAVLLLLLLLAVWCLQAACERQQPAAQHQEQQSQAGHTLSPMVLHMNSA